jgi:hypothetical protein
VAGYAATSISIADIAHIAACNSWLSNEIRPAPQRPQTLTASCGLPMICHPAMLFISLAPQ